MQAATLFTEHTRSLKIFSIFFVGAQDRSASHLRQRWQAEVRQVAPLPVQQRLQAAVKNRKNLACTSQAEYTVTAEPKRLSSEAGCKGGRLKWGKCSRWLFSSTMQASSPNHGGETSSCAVLGFVLRAQNLCLSPQAEGAG